MKTQNTTAANVMKAAWAAFKAQAVRTRAMFAKCLKAAWAATKIGRLSVQLFECGSKQDSRWAATYKQLQYLESFKNVMINCPSSAFTTRFTKSDASQMIDYAKSGAVVIVNR